MPVPKVSLVPILQFESIASSDTYSDAVIIDLPLDTLVSPYMSPLDRAPRPRPPYVKMDGNRESDCCVDLCGPRNHVLGGSLRGMGHLG